MTIVNSIEEFKLAFGVPTIAGIQKAIYKSTDCGCTFDEIPDGIRFSGYAEGADADCPEHTLSYPFYMADFWSELDDADVEGCEMWNLWNNEEQHRIEHPEDMHENKFNPYW